MGRGVPETEGVAWGGSNRVPTSDGARGSALCFFGGFLPGQQGPPLPFHPCGLCRGASAEGPLMTTPRRKFWFGLGGEGRGG